MIHFSDAAEPKKAGSKEIDALCIEVVDTALELEKKKVEAVLTGPSSFPNKKRLERGAFYYRFIVAQAKRRCPDTRSYCPFLLLITSFNYRTFLGATKNDPDKPSSR